MENPVIPQKNPYKVRVEKGKTYFWKSNFEQQIYPRSINHFLKWICIKDIFRFPLQFWLLAATNHYFPFFSSK